MRLRFFFRAVLLAGLFGLLAPLMDRPLQFLSAQESKLKPTLTLIDNRAAKSGDIIVETGEWRVAFGLLYNGGVYRLYDKVNDPHMKDNLVCDRNYTQGGIFDYDVYLYGPQEFMSTLGPNDDQGATKLEILENTKTRVRVKQFCRPRLNNGDGTPKDPYIELAMIEETTEWTYYPTGRVAIKFDAVVAPDWTGLVSQGPGGTGNGISVDGYTVTASNGTDFMSPWVTTGDTIESKSGGWGPYYIARRQNKNTLQLVRELPNQKFKELPKAERLDFAIRRPAVSGETISIHADGGARKKPREQCWLGGSNGVPVFNLGRMGDIHRPQAPPVQNDYVFAHWSVARGFGSMLAFHEPYQAAFAVVNDFSYEDISYTQYVGGTSGPFQPIHRHFLAQLGIENARQTPKIKGIPDSLPFADDYRAPYAEARTGSLMTSDGIVEYGFHVPTGAYQIAARNKAAAIAFDANRGGTVDKPIAYQTPAVLVSGLDAPDKKLAVELSEDSGKTYRLLAENEYNLTTRAEAAQLGGKDRRLIQLLLNVPADATGDRAWVLRLRAKK